MHTFPEIKKKLHASLSLYQDRYKVWQKSQLKSISYFKDLSFESLEEMTYKLTTQFFEEG